MKSKIDFHDIDTLRRIYGGLEKVQDPAKRDAIVEAFHTRFMEFVPQEKPSRGVFSGVLNVLYLARDHLNGRIERARNGLNGGAFVDGKRTYSQIADEYIADGMIELD